MSNPSRERVERTVELMRSVWAEVLEREGDLDDTTMMRTLRREYQRARREGRLPGIVIPAEGPSGDRTRGRLNLLFAGEDWDDIIEWERET